MQARNYTRPNLHASKSQEAPIPNLAAQATGIYRAHEAPTGIYYSSHITTVSLAILIPLSIHTSVLHIHSDDMKRSRNHGPHWRIPALMLSSLIIGVALAIAHHAFYSSLAGTAVSSHPIKLVSWTTTQQQVNIAIGTAFAFVVKASLILACSTAYMQLLFGVINQKAFKLEVLDNWFGGLHDLWSLGCLASYWRYPLLTLMALTCWLLPIAAIISPASLNVVIDRIQPSPIRSEFVPQPAFKSLAYCMLDWGGWKGNGRLAYDWPIQEVSRIAYAAATAGTILPVEAPGTNASWQVQFDAPRLSCNDVDNDLREAIKENMGSVLLNWTSYTSSLSLDSQMFSYVAWSAESNDTEPYAFKLDSQRSGVWVLQDNSARVPYWKGSGVDVFMAVFPRTEYDYNAQRDLFPHWSDDVKDADYKRILYDWYWEDATLIRCSVIPTSYHLGFKFDGLNQQQQIEVLDMKNATGLMRGNDTPVLQLEASDGYPLLMSRFNAQNKVPLDVTNITEDAVHSMQLMSYAAIQQGVMAFLLGATNRNNGSRGLARVPMSKNTTIGYSTQILSTVLANTNEMAALNFAQQTAQSLTNKTSGLAFDQATSLLPTWTSDARRPLIQVMEELYFNITMSMASSPALTYNASSPLAPGQVDVTFDLFGNVYSYESDKLWLAYGVAIGVTVLNVMIGLWTVARTGASFMDKFSTIVRAARNANIEVDMFEERLAGKDPLPKTMAKAEMRMRKAPTLSQIKHLGLVAASEMRRANGESE